MQSLRKDPQKIAEVKKHLESFGIKIVSGSFDVEEIDEVSEDDFSSQIKPYDPSQIDISPKNQSLDNILDRMEHDEIDLMPDFQRKAGLWTQQQKVNLLNLLF